MKDFKYRTAECWSMYVLLLHLAIIYVYT